MFGGSREEVLWVSIFPNIFYGPIVPRFVEEYFWRAIRALRNGNGNGKSLLKFQISYFLKDKQVHSQASSHSPL